MSNLLEKASIILTPTAYNTSEALCVKPSDGTGDFDFSRATEATRVNSQGLIETIGINLPRINYEGGCGSWLFEPQSTNLIPYSEDFSDSSWIVQSGITITTNTTDTLSPSGLNNANKVVSTDNTRGFYSIPASTTNDVTRTIYLKGSVGGESVTFKDGGGFGGSVTHTLTTEWARYEFKTTNDGNIYKGLYVDDISVGTIYAWGAQVEEQSYATSYIPTEGSTVTRNQDVCTNGGSLATINSTEGVLYAEIAALSNDGGNRRISLNDGSDNNRINLMFTSVSNQIVCNYKANGTTRVSLSTISYSVIDINKIAFKWKLGDFQLFVNGVKISTDNNTTMINANTLNTIDFRDGNALNPFFGKTKALAVWKEALSDSELQSLTTI